MKRIIAAAVLTLAGGILSDVAAQTPSDDGIRMRSAELARAKRMDEVEINSDGGRIDVEKIKKYFEGIQKLQDSIIGAYTTGAQIDYRKINKSSAKMTEMGAKLKAALFSPPDEVQKSAPRAEKDVKKLIVELDNAIGRFVVNPIFQREKSVAPDASKKAVADLDAIIGLSRALAAESKRRK